MPTARRRAGAFLLFAPAALVLSGCGDWSPLLPTTPAGSAHFFFLLSGLDDTILISLWSIAFGSLIGLAGALLSRSRLWPARKAVWLYVELLRMVPLFVVLLWINYALPIAVKSLPAWVGETPLVRFLTQLTPFTVAVVGLSLNAGAFMVEIFRAGIESVGKGQIDAGYAFGLSRVLVMRRIVLPQAARRMLPPTTSQFIAIVKDSSLAAVVNVMEITRNAMRLQTQILHPLEIYSFLALEYIALLSVLTALARYLERRFPQYH